MDSHSSKNFVIGFIGHARSGKDTAARIFSHTVNKIDVLKEDISLQAKYYALADPIKDGIAASLQDYAYEEQSKKEHDQQQSVIDSNLTASFVSFIQHDVSTFEDRFRTIKDILREHKEKNKLYKGLDIRKLYQEFGSILRSQDPDIFVKLLVNRIREAYSAASWYSPSIVINNIIQFHLITDIRFPNEAEILKKEFGKDLFLIKIERPELKPLIDSKTPPYDHESELYIDKIPFDLKIINNGDLKQFEEKAESIFRRMLTMILKGSR